jgi:nitrile hydratase
MILNNSAIPLLAAQVVKTMGEEKLFSIGDKVRVMLRQPIGHYRVPAYYRGRTGLVEAVIEPRSLDNEEEGFGRNAGNKRHYYRIAFSMEDIWSGYTGQPMDSIRIEIFESWLEKVQ